MLIFTPSRIINIVQNHHDDQISTPGKAAGRSGLYRFWI